MAKNLLLIIGGVVIVGVAGFALNKKYHWFGAKPMLMNKPVPSSSRISRSSAPRGRLPWAVGDVGLWDDENPSFCDNCAKTCNTSYAEKSSTQCEMCQSKCPGMPADEQ